MTKRFSLDGTQLKFLALLFMLIDHIHYFFEFTGAIPEVFFIIGRLSAYLFLFCMIEGFRHTRSRTKYFLRIYVLAATMGFIYHRMSYHGVFVRSDGFYPINGILLNLVILCIVWHGIDWMKAGYYIKGFFFSFAPFCYALIARGFTMRNSTSHLFIFFNHTFLPNMIYLVDGGLPYIITGIVLYAFKENRKVQAVAFVISSFIMQVLFRGWVSAVTDPTFAWSQMLTDISYWHWFSIFTVFIFLMYNEQKGKGCKQLFYWFYPAHIYILYEISCILCISK